LTLSSQKLLSFRFFLKTVSVHQPLSRRWKSGLKTHNTFLLKLYQELSCLQPNFCQTCIIFRLYGKMLERGKLDRGVLEMVDTESLAPQMILRRKIDAGVNWEQLV
jgi:hypothetical protein